MKKFIFITCMMLTLGITCHSQEKQLDENILTYKCDDFIDQDIEKGMVTLNGNVELKTSVFVFENADKIVINRNNKEIIVSGPFKVFMNGGTIQESPELKKHVLRYKLGEKVAYIE